MSSVGRIAALVIVLVALALAASWLWRRVPAPGPVPLAPPPPTSTRTRPPTSLPTSARAPAGYRLAGVAVGQPESFAVVEAPSGANGLYRVDDVIPGLGRLAAIEAERIVVEGDAGRFELWLVPAPTSTPAPPSTVTLGSTPREPTPRPQPPRPAAGTARESTP